MAKRVTAAEVMIEQQLADVKRVTAGEVMVEYASPSKMRLTATVVMVEYVIIPVAAARKEAPAGQSF